MLTFDRGRTYSRPDVKERAGLPRAAKGGNWDTGVVEHGGEFVVFANVGTQGRTGHDYGNRWEGDLLRWYHKSGSHLGWDSVQRLLDRDRKVHIFWRSSNSEPFTYAGLAAAVEVADTTPVEVLWSFGGESHSHQVHSSPARAQVDLVASPEQVSQGSYHEGAVTRILVNAYERDRAARQACIEQHGLACAVCEFRFDRRYGELGAGFIHVHHLVPLSELRTDYQVNPVADLRPVCPNCHAMLHRRRPPLSIEELRARLLSD